MEEKLHQDVERLVNYNPLYFDIREWGCFCEIFWTIIVQNFLQQRVKIYCTIIHLNYPPYWPVSLENLEFDIALAFSKLIHSNKLVINI